MAMRAQPEPTAAGRPSRRGRAAAFAPLVVAVLLAPPGAGGAGEGGSPARVLQVSGARIRVFLPARPVDAGEDALLEWIADAARAVAAYGGRFPVRAATVRLRSHGGRGVGQGLARFREGPDVLVSVGEETDREDLRRDWVMTHELIHLGFPSVDDRCWMEEGLATYLEPVVRARSGALSPEAAWEKLAVFFPRGLPKAHDRGLDLASSWGRTYWGGAMFWFVADVEIRSRTRGRRGLDDVLRAVVAAGGTIGRRWHADDVIAVGDAVAGAPVLRRLFHEMAPSPYRVDLEALWRSLGVRRVDGRVVLDDAAPRAWVRRAIAGEAPPRRAPAEPRGRRRAGTRRR